MLRRTMTAMGACGLQLHTDSAAVLLLVMRSAGTATIGQNVCTATAAAAVARSADCACVGRAAWVQIVSLPSPFAAGGMPPRDQCEAISW